MNKDKMALKLFVLIISVPTPTWKLLNSLPASPEGVLKNELGRVNPIRELLKTKEMIITTYKHLINVSLCRKSIVL